MQRSPSPISTPNTFRDSNDNPTTISQPNIFSSTTTRENMNSNKSTHHSIVKPIEIENEPVFVNNNPSSYPKVLVKSIVRTPDSDDEGLVAQQTQPVFPDNMVTTSNIEPQASGYGATRSDDIDPDEAYALQLQQEEYERGSIRPIRFAYDPFEIDHDSESEILFPPRSNDGPFANDAEYAAYVQAEGRAQQQRRQRGPFQPFRQRQRLNNEPNTNGEANPLSTTSNRSNEQSSNNHANESDEDGYRISIPFPFFRMPGRDGQPTPEDFLAFINNHRRYGRRRTGNLEETEDDFGPEDYERLIQLDDKIPKKKLSKYQIDTVSKVTYHRKPGSNEEENKCSVCLESFEENQQLREYPCKHLYHLTCSDRWLKENNVCPICREPPVNADATKDSRSNRDTGHSRYTTNHTRISTNRRPTHRNDNNNNNNHNSSNNTFNNNNAQRGQHRRERPS